MVRRQPRTSLHGQEKLPENWAQIGRQENRSGKIAKSLSSNARNQTPNSPSPFGPCLGLVEGSHSTKQDQNEHEAKQLADSFLKSPFLGGCADEVGVEGHTQHCGTGQKKRASECPCERSPERAHDGIVEKAMPGRAVLAPEPRLWRLDLAIALLADVHKVNSIQLLRLGKDNDRNQRDYTDPVPIASGR